MPEAFWSKILANQAQLAEWRDLFALDDLLKAAKKRKPDAVFLKLHPTLVVDTKHFSDDFKWRLLASFDNLEEILDGLLVKSENFQALDLLAEKYRERVKCIYIDPPYNTGNDEFLYRDNYQHACWLAMISDRVISSVGYLDGLGALLVSVDEVEQSALEVLLRSSLGLERYVADFVWEGGRKNDSRLTSISHEYIICFARNMAELKKANSIWQVRKNGIDDIYAKAEALLREHGKKDSLVSKRLKEWLEGLPDNHPAKRHKHYWAVDRRGVYFPSDIGWHGGNGPRYTVLHPDTKKPCPVPERGWMYPTAERMQEAIADDRVHFWSDHQRVPCSKAYLKENESEVLNSVFYCDRRGASKRLRDVMRRDASGRDRFENPKDERVLARFFNAIGRDRDLFMDYFAGSGSTAHAVLAMNRADGGRRRFLLAEVGAWFDLVMLERIKKVTFTPEWKDGKPKRMATAEEAERSPRIIKYHTIESYEDALENITIPESGTAQTALALYGDDYLLKYMLDMETRGSASLLNVEMFKDPFDYKLQVQGENGRQETTVDLVETFNYLLGLDVRKLRQFEDGGRKYRAVLGNDRKGKSVVVVWRSVKDIEENKKALLRDREFIEKTVLPTLLGDGTKPDRLFVNGASFVENAEAIEPEFKRLMFAPLSY